ncbi:MAG TPA: cation transporter, partial [Acetobacteraceae bacterium]|nr:cation transporter [Acetobacteraceae bacterium]
MDMIERAGAATALRYRVRGMDCPSCAGKIETALARLPGAADVRVNYHSQVLDLALDEQATSRAVLEQRITDLGYGVSPLPTAADLAASGTSRTEELPIGGDTVEATPSPWRSRKALLAIGALFLAGLAVEHLLPDLGAWPSWPAAVLGLAFYGRRALAAARNGSPFSIEMLVSVATAGALAIGAASEAAVV